jgi:hypothetical protein
LVEAENRNGELYYKNTINKSGNSTLRLIFYRNHPDFDKNILFINEQLQKIGCIVEKSHLENLFSVEVSADKALWEIIEVLKKAKTEDKLDFEISSLRQKI